MKQSSDWLVGVSVLAIVMAVIEAFSSADVWLAATQWLLVAVCLGIYALYAKK
ncbi:MAG: hypothetical protein CEN88_126 [Candidatus Berkelbacteria bacterium Licking1014_2]|uniref:Uncharacterized protein n=1 Tax=Candidatus Berkelbacteria bacterium Licking1014_2 TaxID=2017146 RepID=A0A554LWG4_9BACT|nr:MAG: hypothetical protein CEN88_126 [Candidatus Berkelbacteria bacterium Licking1014_2]